MCSPKPTSKPTMLTALSWMSSAREKLHKTVKKTHSVEEKMEEIRIVNRAKWLLISELKLVESEAHRYIKNRLWTAAISSELVVEEIIKTYT